MQNRALPICQRVFGIGLSVGGIFNVFCEASLASSDYWADPAYRSAGKALATGEYFAIAVARQSSLSWHPGSRGIRNLDSQDDIDSRDDADTLDDAGSRDIDIGHTLTDRTIGSEKELASLKAKLSDIARWQWHPVRLSAESGDSQMVDASLRLAPPTVEGWHRPQFSSAICRRPTCIDLLPQPGSVSEPRIALSPAFLSVAQFSSELEIVSALEEISAASDDLNDTPKTETDVVAGNLPSSSAVPAISDISDTASASDTARADTTKVSREVESPHGGYRLAANEAQVNEAQVNEAQASEAQSIEDTAVTKLAQVPDLMIEVLSDDTLSQNDVSENDASVSDEPVLDEDLGSIRVQQVRSRTDEDLGILRLMQTAQAPPPPPKPPIAFLAGRLGFFETANAFRNNARLNEQIYQTGLAFFLLPQLSESTSLYAIAETNLARYDKFDVVNYNEVEFQVGVRQRILPRTHAQLGWRNQRLYSPGFREKLFSINYIDALVSHRSIFTSRMWLDSFYQMRLGFGDPQLFSRFRQTFTLSLNYAARRDFRTSLLYQLDFDNYTDTDRYDTYQQFLGIVSYNLTPESRISLFGGTRFGRSSSPIVNLDDTFYGAGLNVNVPLF